MRLLLAEPLRLLVQSGGVVREALVSGEEGPQVQAKIQAGLAPYRSALEGLKVPVWTSLQSDAALLRRLAAGEGVDGGSLSGLVARSIALEHAVIESEGLDCMDAGSLGESLFRLSVGIRTKLQQQALIVSSAVSAYTVLTPAVVDWMTGLARWPGGAQIGVTVGAMVLFSFAVVYGLLPAGWRLQRSEKFWPRLLGKLATIGLEALASIGLLEGLGLVYGWNPWKTLQTGAWMGATQGLPLSTVSRKWGNHPLLATAMRQGAMMAIQTNAAVINALAAEHGDNLSSQDVIKIVMVSAALDYLFYLLPSFGEGHMSTRQRRPESEWSLLSPTEKSLLLLDDQRLWPYRYGHTLVKVSLPEGVTLANLTRLMKKERCFEEWGFFTMGELRRLLHSDGPVAVRTRLSRQTQNVIVGWMHFDELGRLLPDFQKQQYIAELALASGSRIHFFHSTGHVHTGEEGWSDLGKRENPLATISYRQRVAFHLAPTHEEAVVMTDRCSGTLDLPAALSGGQTGWVRQALKAVAESGEIFVIEGDES